MPSTVGDRWLHGTLRSVEEHLNRLLEGFVDAYYGCCATITACGSAYASCSRDAPNRLVVNVVIVAIGKTASARGSEAIPSSLFADESDERDEKPCTSIARWCSNHVLTFTLLDTRCSILHDVHLSVSLPGMLWADITEKRTLEKVDLRSILMANHATTGSQPQHSHHSQHVAGGGGGSQLPLLDGMRVATVAGQAVQWMEDDVLFPRLTEIGAAPLGKIGPRSTHAHLSTQVVASLRGPR
jgi:hypothetical protein